MSEIGCQAATSAERYGYQRFPGAVELGKPVFESRLARDPSAGDLNAGDLGAGDGTGAEGGKDKGNEGWDEPDPSVSMVLPVSMVSPTAGETAHEAAVAPSFFGSCLAMPGMMGGSWP
jgi:hypothetical protein